jgi:hypothetical protein
MFVVQDLVVDTVAAGLETVAEAETVVAVEIEVAVALVYSMP